MDVAVPGQEVRTGLLRNRAFILLWLAYGVSAFGDHLSELGLMRELAVEQSDRQVQTQALMTFLFFVPFFAFGWLTGTIADRLPRRAVMITADLARAGIVFCLPLWVEWNVRARGQNLQQGDLFVALLPLIGLGVFAAFFSPARQALLPQLVRQDQLVQANSISSGLGTIAAMLSNMVGGVLAGISPRLNFMANVGTFLASAVLLAGIRMPSTADKGTGRGGDKEQQREGGDRGQATGDSRQQRTKGDAGGLAVASAQEPFGQMVVQGVSYVRTHTRVAELILLAALFWTAAGVFTSVLPSVVFHRYGLDATMAYAWVGWMRGTLAGGMLLGAIALTLLGDRIRSELVNLLALVGAGVSLIAFAWADGIAAGLPLAILVGIGGAMLLISVNTMLQRIVPNRWRGRIFGIVDVVTMAGLLAATGMLGLWPIPGLDERVPLILTVVGVVMVLVGAAMHVRQSRRIGMSGWQLLVWRLNEFYAKWWFRTQREGPSTVPPHGPAILAANHTSYIDPLVMYATGPQRLIGFMVAKEYYDAPVVGRLLKGIGCIPATRSGQDLAATREAIRRLQEGELVGIFPQGRIQREGETVEARGGIVLLALRSRMPVIPVHISGTRHSENHVWTFLRRHRVRVRYGKPIDLSAYYDRPIEKATRDRIGTLILQRIMELGKVDGAGGSRATGNG
jgi:1-acyl-sn-glycerol-3-phosphate acyltransferase